ncbi:MAG TPA: PilZ domain-containing protein, partial [Gemmataceae bacterium]|nr:PilZ domain-containing protein [Gemmataceae bacterium]
YAAAGLDHLQSSRKIQHLWLQPRQLVIQEDRAQILSFGLAETWWARTGRPIADLNPRYSAPELERRNRGIQCDQYSLALIYTEMLTGRHPWRGRSGAEGARNPDLALLNRQDRAVIERALSRDHRQRFDSATAMVEALEAAGNFVLPPQPLRPLFAPPELGLAKASSLSSCNTLSEFVNELVREVVGKEKTPDELKIRFVLEPSQRLEWPELPGTALDKHPVLDDFCRQWHAKTMHRKDGLVILAINAAPSVWQWLLGRRLGLEVRLEFLPVTWGKKAEVVVAVKPFGCAPERATQLLMELGPKLLHSVRAYLHAQPEQRRRERLAFRRRLRVCPIVNGAPADPIECFTKDISARGIGFYLPVELQACQVYVNLPELAKIASHAALAQVVRKQPAEDGWIEVGATFPISAEDLGPRLGR